MVALTAAGQVAAAREADAYMDDVLAELDLQVGDSALVPRAFAGVDGRGLPIDTLLEQALADIEALIDLESAKISEAVEQMVPWLEGVTQTLIADTNRAGELTAMAQRPWLNGYIRAAEPGACSRCIILSGKFFLFNEGFLRHPRCRCTHLPAPDARTDEGKAARDRLLAVESPERHFDALTEAEQDRIFTKDGAQAIRDGADIHRVVNARRGMSKAQSGRIKRVDVHGRPLYVTTEATTRRGRTRDQIRGVRLMPESIMEIAGDDASERIRLLRLHGYIT